MGERLLLGFGADSVKTLVPIDLYWEIRCLHANAFSFNPIFVKLALTRTGINSRTSSNFHQIGPFLSELGALERLKNPINLQFENGVSKLACSF